MRATTKRKPNLRIVKPPADAAPGDGAADLKGDVESLVTVRARLAFRVTDEQRGVILDVVTNEFLARNAQAPDPLLYSRDGEYVAVVRGLNIAAVEPIGMTLRLLDMADWTSGEKDSATDPPHSIVAGLLSKEHRLIRELPPLVGVTGTPTFSADGVFETEPGYHVSTRTFYAPRGLVIPPVPEKPTINDIEKAKQIILTEILGDFAFVSDAERAHAVAMLLLGFVRAMIDGPTPMHGVDAASPKTGKGYLVDAVATVLTGGTITPTVVPTDEAEWQKALLSKMIESPQIVNFDNVDSHLKSRSLNLLLTGGGINGRLLGATRMLDLKCNSVLICTGNNLDVGNELVRRVVRIRMERDVNVRVNWRHRDLLKWIRERRGEIVKSCAVLVKAWIAAGGKPGRALALESFVQWSDVIGGILDTVGIEGFLGNMQEWNEEVADEATETLIVFFGKWWERYQDRPQTAATLLGLAWDVGLNLDARADELQKARMALGRLFRQNKGRVLGGLKLVKIKLDRNGVAQWRLLKGEGQPS